MAVAKLTFAGGAQGLQSFELNYIIEDALDPDDARAAMMAEAPPFLGVWVPVDFSIGPFGDSDSLWEGSVTYGPRTNNSPDGQNDPTYSFELGTATTRVTQSLETVDRQSYRFALPPPDFKRTIGVQDDGTVDGVELNFPIFSWTETHYLPYSMVNRSYFTTLFNLTAKMNIAPFRDFQRGEVLLMGCNGSKRYSAADWEMQFKFIASPNVTNLKVGPDITIASKLGHDYLWVQYTNDIDRTANAMVRIPRNVFVERVYEFEDYGRLKLVNPLAL